MRNTILALTLVRLALVAWSASGADHRPPRPRPTRALPPPWSKDVIGIFFEDARTKLVGPRPNFGSRRAAAAPAASSGQGTAATGTFRWSSVIAAETLEDEIKAQKLLLDQQVTTPGRFKRGQYHACRERFGTLAVMFAIVAEYDGRVRWQEQAAGIRDSLALARQRCQVGSAQSFREAKRRKQELNDVVRGATVEVRPAQRMVAWDEVTDVEALMRRAEQAHQQRLAPWLADARQLPKYADAIFHEAQVLAALAVGLRREGLPGWDDQTYLEYARQLERAAIDMVRAVRQNNYEALRAAAGRATRVCGECHDGYRE